MGIQPLTFTGVSSFSSDFQTILSRAVQIAQIPVTQLQNKDNDTLTRKTLLGSLGTAVNALATSLKNLGTTSGSHALSATSSDTSKVTVVNAGATAATSYTIDSITSAAAPASERSLNSYGAQDAVSSNGSLRLVLGDNEYNFTLTDNTLTGLRDKINNLGAGVTASILTTPDGNYLSIAANATGATTLSLIDDPDGTATPLLTSSNQGTNAVFELNGIPISQPGNVVNSVVPGLIFTIRASSSSPVTLSLGTDTSQVSIALQDFVSNFNSLRQQVNAQIGENAGLLTGDTVITQLSSALRSIAAYQTSSGTIKNLAALGIEFSSTGEASFNADTFNALSSSDITAAFDYLGSETTGLGGFSQTLSQIGDPTTGLIKVEQDGLDRTDQLLQNQITTLNERITIMQNGLAAKLQQADALLASLASQQQTLTASLQGLSLTLYGKNQNSN